MPWRHLAVGGLRHLPKPCYNKEIVASEWNWGKKIVMVPNPWGKGVEESYDFDVTKLDKLFDFLLEREQIKLLANHVLSPLD